jgi:hypothetical protein
MIRQPTPIYQLFAWWREACGNPDASRSEGLPECGWFKRRLVRNGPWVAARIWCERDIDPETFELTGPERLRCEVDGDYRDAADQWTYLTPITRAEYDALLQRRLTVAEMMTPRQSIDLTRRPIWTP